MDPLLKRMAELEARVDVVEGKDGAGSLTAQAEALAALQGQLSASEELMMSKITQLGTELAHSKQDTLLAAKSSGGTDDSGALTQLLTAQTVRLDELAQDLLTSRKSTTLALATTDAQNSAMVDTLRGEIDTLAEKVEGGVQAAVAAAATGSAKSEIIECVSRLNAMEEQSFEDMGAVEDRLTALEKSGAGGSGGGDSGGSGGADSGSSSVDMMGGMIRLQEDLDLRLTHVEALVQGEGTGR